MAELRQVAWLLFHFGMYSASPDLYFDAESGQQLLKRRFRCAFPEYSRSGAFAEVR